VGLQAPPRCFRPGGGRPPPARDRSWRRVADHGSDPLLRYRPLDSFPSLGDRRLLPRTLTVRGIPLADAAIMSIWDGPSNAPRPGRSHRHRRLALANPLREFVGGGSRSVSRRVGSRNRSKSLDARVSCFFTVQPRRILVCPKVYPSPRTAATVLRSFCCGVSLDGYFAGVGQMTNRPAPFVFPANVRLWGNS
jgi:hypothetical protein